MNYTSRRGQSARRLCHVVEVRHVSASATPPMEYERTMDPPFPRILAFAGRGFTSDSSLLLVCSSNIFFVAQGLTEFTISSSGPSEPNPHANPIFTRHVTTGRQVLMDTKRVVTLQSTYGQQNKRRNRTKERKDKTRKEKHNKKRISENEKEGIVLLDYNARGLARLVLGLDPASLNASVMVGLTGTVDGRVEGDRDPLLTGLRMDVAPLAMALETTSCIFAVTLVNTLTPSSSSCIVPNLESMSRLNSMNDSIMADCSLRRW